MPHEFRYRPASSAAGSLLASAIVMLLGLIGGITFFVLFSPEPLLATAALVGIWLLVWAFLYLLQLSSTPLRSHFEGLFGRKSKGEPEYEPTLRSCDSSDWGNKRPPSADDIREMKSDTASSAGSTTSTGCDYAG